MKVFPIGAFFCLTLDSFIIHTWPFLTDANCVTILIFIFNNVFRLHFLTALDKFGHLVYHLPNDSRRIQYHQTGEDPAEIVTSAQRWGHKGRGQNSREKEKGK